MNSIEELYQIFSNYLYEFTDEETGEADKWKLKDNAPSEAVKAFNEFEKIYQEALNKGYKI